MNKLKLMMTTGMVVAATACAVVAAGDVSAVNCPASMGGGSANSLAECSIKDSGDNRDLMDTVLTIVNVILAVMGIVAVIMIIIGGVQYTTSSGDPAKTTKAKNTIMYSVIGLVVALLAFAIVNFVLTNVFTDTNGGGGNNQQQQQQQQQQQNGD